MDSGIGALVGVRLAAISLSCVILPMRINSWLGCNVRVMSKFCVHPLPHADRRFID